MLESTALAGLRLADRAVHGDHLKPRFGWDLNVLCRLYGLEPLGTLEIEPPSTEQMLAAIHEELRLQQWANYWSWGAMIYQPVAFGTIVGLGG